MKKINLIYLVENFNWQNAYISIISALSNSNHSLNIIFFFTELNNIAIDQLRNIERKYNFRCKMQFIKTSEKDLLYKNSWIRVLIPELCTDIDKAIVLAGDANIIVDDLWDLYNTDLGNNIVGLIPDVKNNSNKELKSRLKIDTLFDFRVILLDLKKYREENCKEKFRLYLNNFSNISFNSYCAAINKIFNGRIKTLSQKYSYKEVLENKLGDIQIIKSQDYKFAKDNPSIIYFDDISPQYITCRNSMKDLWWEYAKQAPFKIEELQSYKLAATSAKNSFKYTWLLSRIFPYIKPYWFRITLGFLIAIPLGLLDGVTAFALKPYMDYVVGGKTLEFTFLNSNITITSIQMAFILPFAVILFAIIQGVLRYLNGYLSSWTSAHITNDVKFDLFKRLVHMHPQFFDENSSGIIISRYMGDPGAASAGIVDNIKTITTSLCGALGLIAVMLYSSWKLAIIGVLVLCIAFLPVALIRKRIKEASNRSMVIGGNITTNINETYNGNKVMAAYGLQDKMYDYFEKQTWDGYNVGMSLYKRSGWMSPLMYLIASCGIATVLGVGTYLINSGQMTAGSFASFVTSLLLLYKPVKTLGNTLTGIQGIFVAMGRVFELFDLKPEIVDSPNARELQGLNKSIKFENVNFEYIPNQLVLKNLNLSVAKNETLAIVGNSGGGKSTLVNLIPRFYDIKSGAIKIDDIDIREYTIDSLRQNISMVFQDNFLYSGTIKDNIMMGNSNATTEELMLAIKSAHLQDLIQELPDGLDTMLGERGLTLSGGQRQRVAIARAMLRNAPIVILDEATSALDNESEAIVQKAMDNLMKDRTVFIIAHRLSTIKNADRIAVINEGELVELGTHDELMSIDNGQYKALYEMQFKKQETSV